MISSMLEPASRFSKTVATGIRVSLNTHSPLRLSGTLSTAGHCDQSRVAMFVPSFHRKLFTTGSGASSRVGGFGGRNFPIRQGSLGVAANLETYPIDILRLRLVPVRFFVVALQHSAGDFRGRRPHAAQCTGMALVFFKRFNVGLNGLS